MATKEISENSSRKNSTSSRESPCEAGAEATEETTEEATITRSDPLEEDRGPEAEGIDK